MEKKLIVIALAVSAFASAPRSNAGTEVVEPQYAPRQTYNYYTPPPPPRPVYYAPVPVSVVVYPTFGYYSRPYRVYYRHHRAYSRPYYRHHHHWY